MDLDELVRVCAKMDFKFEEEDIRRIDEATQDQSSSELWFKLRAGRITASMFKKACITNINNPSKTTIREICDPKNNISSSQAMEYGKDNKVTAFNQYKEKMKKEHKSFDLQKCGLRFNNKYPGFAASPNRISSCTCHDGKILLHIKCPSKESIEKALELADPYIKKGKNEEEYVMIKEHASYYQVQMLIFMTESKAAHFVVWTPSRFIVINVEPNPTFWKKNFQVADKFLRTIILPEMLKKKIIQKN